MFDDYFLTDEWVFYPQTHILKTKKEHIRLRRHVALLLTILCKNHGNTVSHDDLINQIWDGNYYTGLKSLRSSIWELRQYVNHVDTQPRKGYVLNQAVTYVSIGEKIKKSYMPIFLGSFFIFVFFYFLILFKNETQNAFELGTSELVTQSNGIIESPKSAAQKHLLAYVKKNNQEKFGVFVQSTKNNSEILISNPKRDSGAPTWSPDYSKISYLEKTTEYHAEIKIYDLHSKTTKNVGTAAFSPLAYTPVGLDWSPDGRHLVFAISKGEDWKTSIAFLNLETKKTVILTNPEFIDTNPVWLDPQQILFTRLTSSDSADLYTVDLTGKTNLYTKVEAPILGYDFFDERYLLLSIYKEGRWGGYVYDSNKQILLNSNFGDGFQMPNISGDSVYFIKSKPHTKLVLSALDDVAKHREIHLNYIEEFLPIYNEDNNDLIYISTRSGHSELWRMNLISKQLNQLTDLKTRVSFPHISPNDRYVAFTKKSEKESLTRIAVLDTLTNEIFPMTEDPGNFTMARWLDDHTLLSMKFVNENIQLWHHVIHKPELSKLVVSSGVKDIIPIPLSSYVLVKIDKDYYKIDIHNPTQKKQLNYLYGNKVAVTEKGIYYLSRDNNFYMRKHIEDTEMFIGKPGDLYNKVINFSVNENNNTIVWLLNEGTEKNIYRKHIAKLSE